MKLSELIAEELDKVLCDPNINMLYSVPTRLHECVKPLDWVVCYGIWRAKTGFGNYMVEGKILTLPHTLHTQQIHNDTHEAKAAAQAHYAAQIIEGLDL